MRPRLHTIFAARHAFSMNLPSLLALPDIAAMLVLMAVLDWLRRKHRDASVDLWMLGLTFILVEAIAVAVLRGSPALSSFAHALALDSYVLAAVTFGWAARQDLFPGTMQLPLLFAPAVSILALATLYGFNLPVPAAYIWITALSLLLGTVYILFVSSLSIGFKSRLLAIHLTLWMPLTWMAVHALLRQLVYWGLACLYLLVAASFRHRVRRDGLGGFIIVAGFVAWAMCFLAHPYVRDMPALNSLNEQLWTMQKFLVIVGMLLVLLEDQTRRLEGEAMRDPLTGLPNRRLFDDRLLQALSRARRTGMSAAVFAIDLDNFKQINDLHGHRTGDLVLIRVGGMLKSRIRGADTLARSGGDEFNVIVNDLSRAVDCDRIAESLRSSLTAIELPGGLRYPLSASVGYAIFPDDAADPAALCELADARMYDDKRATPAAVLPRTILSVPS
jgi:diguanylate cyclase (GGDEF)-like protein